MLFSTLNSTVFHASKIKIRDLFTVMGHLLLLLSMLEEKSEKLHRQRIKGKKSYRKQLYMCSIHLSQTRVTRTVFLLSLVIKVSKQHGVKEAVKQLSSLVIKAEF